MSGQNKRLEQARKQAKALLKSYRAGDPEAAQRLSAHLPTDGNPLRLAQVQWVIALEQGYPSWPRMKLVLEEEARRSMVGDEIETELLQLVLGHGWQRPQRKAAFRLAESHPELGSRNIWMAALVGDKAALANWLGHDPRLALSPRPVTLHPPLYLAAASGVVDCARLLLEAGADPNEQYIDPDWPEWPLRPLFAASGIANSLEMVRLLLAAGADPNDNECMYHSVEHQNWPLTQALIDAGATWKGTNALLRLLDYEDPERLRLAISAGADVTGANETTRPLLHAIRRGRSAETVRILLDAGADPLAVEHGPMDAYRLASQCGAAEVVQELERRGVRPELSRREKFMAACARADGEEATALWDEFARLSPEDFRLLPDLAQLGRRQAVKTMVELGWPVDVKGDWDASALNQAAFNGDAQMARDLISHGARWESANGYGGDVWGSVFWSSSNLGSEALVGDHVGVVQELLDAKAPIPMTFYGRDDVREYIDDWLEEHPDWPRSSSP